MSAGTGRPDYVLLGTTSALLLIGTVMVYSASFVVAHNEFNDDAYFLIRQLVWVGIGLLVVVLLPGVGMRSYGAVRWIKLGPFLQLQPSELAKLAIVLYLATGC